MLLGLLEYGKKQTRKVKLRYKTDAIPKNSNHTYRLMKNILSLIFLLKLTLFALASQSSAESARIPIKQKVVDEVSKIPSSTEKEHSVNMGSIEGNTLEKLSDSTQKSLADKKKDIGESIIEGHD